MTGWFWQSIGISEEVAASVEDVQWLWARPTWLIVGLILMIPIGWYIVYRHRRSLPHVADKPRRALSACRIGVLLLLVFVLGGPYVRLDQTIERKPVLAWVTDESSSMKLPAGPFNEVQQTAMAVAIGMVEPDDETGKTPELTDEQRKQLDEMTRAELMQKAIEHRSELMDKLGERFEIKKYRVARRVRAMDDEDETDEPISDAEADDTVLGDAILKAFDDAAGRELAGIVMLTDGQNTHGADPFSVLRRVGVGESGDASLAPVWSIPIGSTEPAPDVSLVDVITPAHVSQGDTVSILATVTAHRIDGEDVKVKLMRGDKEIDSETITLRHGQRIATTLGYEARQVGEHLLRVEVEPVEKETITDNNEQTVRIGVDAERDKVLVIEGYPRWDFRFLDHALRRDRGLEVELVMQSQLLAEGVEPADLPDAAGLPSDVEGWSEYHLVMIGDISPAMLPRRQQELLAQAVEEEGVGLVVQAGIQNMPSAFADDPLVKLLPVEIEPTADGETGMNAPAFAPFSMSVSATGALHPAFAVYSGASRNRRLWSNMPKFYWAAATAETVKPGATLLAEFESTSGKRPLIAEHFAGRGRVLFLGTDGTFRWRRNIGDQLFYRFWGQSIRHVRRTAERSGDESWIEATPHEVEVGGEVSIEMYALNGSGQPRNEDQLTIKISGKDGELRGEQTMTASQASGHYRGIWRADEAGQVTFTYTDPAGESVSAQVAVVESGRERRRPTVDRDTLGELADLSGGDMIELHELASLDERLEGETVTLHRPREAEVWDNWLVLLLLIGLYCTDVGIRRVLGLT